MTALSKLGEAALSYARNGWPVFPVHGIREGRCACGNANCPHPGKVPHTVRGFKDASEDEEIIRIRWQQWPDANIGYPTGEHVVLDVDGPEGGAALAALEKQHGPLPETLTAKTGKGRHFYFSGSGTRIRNSAGKLGPHLDIRGEGGYVILPPSIHPSGRSYEWLTPDLKPAALPAWIAALAQAERPQAGDTSAAEKIAEGQRNVHLTSLAGAMRRRGMTAAAIEAALLEENRLSCNPPLAETDVRRIAQSVCRYPPTASKASPPPVPGVLASDVKPETVKWLWSNHIPLGKVTLFDGDPDEGKSLTSIDLVARATTGQPMPDGTECGCATAGAVIVSLEDGVADTIRPRLEAAGAALEKVRIVSVIKGADGIERTPTLPADLPSIEAAIRSVNARLVVLDPLVAMLGPQTNSHRDQDVRRALAPVAALAAKTGAAVICIRHLNKGGGQNPKYRGGGSIGIIGAARAAFLFAGKPGEEGRCVFAPVKGNLWRGKPAALEYTIEDKGGQPVIAWHGASVHGAESLLAQPEGAEESNAITDARSFLIEFLKDGPREARMVFCEARKAGVSHRTLYRAKAGLGIVSEKKGIGEGQGWEWRLPNIAKDPPKIAKNEGLATLATFGKDVEIKPVNSNGSPKIAKPQSSATRAVEVNLDDPALDTAPLVNFNPNADAHARRFRG